MARLYRRFRGLPPIAQRGVVAVAVAAVVFTASAFRPDPFETATAEAAEINVLQNRAHDRWKEIRAASGETWEPAEAERVWDEVLPPWREARRRLREARSGPLVNFFPPELEEFYAKREEAWEALVRSVRVEDAQLHRRYVELWDEAEAAGEKAMRPRSRTVGRIRL